MASGHGSKPPASRASPAATQWGSVGSPPAVLNWMVASLPSGRILNVGAGPVAPEKDGTTFVGIDLIEPDTAPSSPFAVADATHLPIAAGAFDGALLKDVLEHVADPIGVLRDVHRSCRPGARIVVTVPRAIARVVWDDPTHIRGFTSDAVMTALRAGGWQPIGRPARIGGLPGIGRFGLESHLLTILRIPALGHWFGKYWFVVADWTHR